MNPESVFCLNIDCPAKGQQGKENIGIHSEKDGRYICKVCGQTFTATKGTVFYRLRTDPAIGRSRVGGSGRECIAKRSTSIWLKGADSIWFMCKPTKSEQNYKARLSGWPWRS